jgi:two-component system response regulator RegA
MNNPNTIRRLLLVDDDPVFSSTLSRSMMRRGLVVDTSSHREAALALANEHVYTDITVDLNLGEQSGLLLIQPLRQLQPSASLLVLTGYASIPTTVQAMKLGADNYLAKPADVPTILRALDQDASDFVSDDASEDFQPMSVSRLEWEHIQRVLAEHEGNISATARALNMHRRTLQRKLAKRPFAK